MANFWFVDLGKGGGQMLWVVERKIQRGRERDIWRGREREREREREMGEREERELGYIIFIEIFILF